MYWVGRQAVGGRYNIIVMSACLDQPTCVVGQQKLVKTVHWFVYILCVGGLQEKKNAHFRRGVVEVVNAY